LYVFGLNTTRVFQIKNGRISPKQLKIIREFFSKAPQSSVKIIVTHHPFISTDGIQRPVVGAKRTLEELEDIRPDLFLSGHLHEGNITHSAEKFSVKNYSSLLIQVGTATSTRHRKDINNFNILNIENGKIAIDHYHWDDLTKNFVISNQEHFLSSASGWKKA
jgi:3',5'-cyclic AMP phosphodiesterase CpdA